MISKLKVKTSENEIALNYDVDTTEIMSEPTANVKIWS